MVAYYIGVTEKKSCLTVAYYLGVTNHIRTCLMVAYYTGVTIHIHTCLIVAYYIVCEMFYNLFNEKLGDELKFVFSPDVIVCG